MLKTNTTIIWVLISILSFSGVIFLFVHLFTSSVPQTVYVNNVTLFNGFNMSKDLGKKHQKQIKLAEKSLDSLITIFNILKEQKNKEKVLELQKQLQVKDQQLAQMNEHLTKDVSQQVWNRLNIYIKEYGTSHKFKFILGTQGNGNVMYAKESLDVTEELLEFANAKYEGN